MKEFLAKWNVQDILAEFDSVDIPVNYKHTSFETSAIRNLIEQHYSTLDFSDSEDSRKFLNLYSNILTQLSELSSAFGGDGEWASRRFSELNVWIEKDGFKFRDGHIINDNCISVLETTSEILEPINGENIAKQLSRINNSVDSDPALAVGTAKELIESVAKTILNERNIPFPKNATVAELIKKVRTELELMPDDIDDNVRGAEVIKQMLSNLGNIAQVMSELRNLYGTGHGKSADAKGITPRHARLAVGAASTLVNFLYETHLERNESSV